LETHDKGIKVDNVISIWSADVKNAHVLAENIKQVNGVERVALQNFPPIGYARITDVAYFRGDIETVVSIRPGNEEFIPFYEMTILAGRNLAPNDSALNWL
jgi:putative ABC transport system permease protein